MTSDMPVLVVGGTGMLGSQVVTALQRRGKSVRALARTSSNTAALQADGVEIARGDMLNPDTLLAAMDGVDAVVTSAAGYTRHSKGDTAEVDTIGNRNLAQAASTIGVRRFVLTSILTCDQTPQVPHFWHKKLAEDHLEQLGVPFVALRPGAFVDQIARVGGDPVTKGRMLWFGGADTTLTFVNTAHLAGNLADAVDADLADGERIDIGWDRAVSINEIARITAELTGRTIKVRTIPAAVLQTVGKTFGRVNPMTRDMSEMIRWFETGNYVADTTRQQQVFGHPPTAEEAIAQMLRNLGHNLT